MYGHLIGPFRLGKRQPQRQNNARPVVPKLRFVVYAAMMLLESACFSGSSRVVVQATYELKTFSMLEVAKLD